jgi:hypothetical protein
MGKMGCFRPSTENIEIIENRVNEKTVSVNELDVSKVNVEICKEPADEIIKESMIQSIFFRILDFV